MSPDRLIPLLLTAAWLLPLGGAVAAWAAGRITVHRHSRLPAWIGTAAIAVSLNLTLWSWLLWWRASIPVFSPRGMVSSPVGPLSGTYYTLGEFGGLSLALDYYVDGLTLLMFGVVTLIATCVHVYAAAYLGSDDEGESGRQEEGEHHGSVSPSPPLPVSPSPLPRFYAFLGLFCHSMLGLVLAGNLLQVFAFWELVGACSYFLIGFHFDRPYAAAAATKAFVMNRVGDAGFLIGMAIIWTGFGTVAIGPERYETAERDVDGESLVIRGLEPLRFVELERDPRRTAESVGADSGSGTLALVRSNIAHDPASGYWNYVPRGWLILAGLALFAGCVGKSAQLPLSTWLPDAMAGPTPVSALVHSATMVAAGVYLVGRVYPLFLPEVLTVVAYVGAATLVYGATCAVVQTDLKRILAYSTVSQLGYMMLALGVGGREAGLFHLVTHAFFKSLLFLAAGAVIVACHHVQDVTRLGGLRKRMPVTAYTSLVGVIAIGGLAVPVVTLFGEPIALSGYHSKDSILAAALAFVRERPEHALLFVAPLVTAGLTAFYMFRFWLLAFAGKPRDEELARHVREPSWLLTGPLVVLAAFAAFVAIGGETGPLWRAIEGSRGVAVPRLRDAVIEAHHAASIWGLVSGTAGTVLALLVYGTGALDARRTFAGLRPVRLFFADGWKLDRLYDLLIVRPLGFVALAASLVDRFVLDKLLHGATRLTVGVARLDRTFDERVVDGLVNTLADATYAAGANLRHVQTGRLRQYVMALAAAAVVLFALAVVLIPK